MNGGTGTTGGTGSAGSTCGTGKIGRTGGPDGCRMTGRTGSSGSAAVRRIAGAAAAAALGWGLGACGPSAEPAPPAEPAAAAAPAVVARFAEPPPARSACWLGVLLPDDPVEVVAEVTGRVRSVAVRPGDAVEDGALIATLAADDLLYERRLERASLAAAESRLAELEIEVRRAAREHRRRIDLGDLVSREQIEAAEFALQAAVQRRDGAAAELARVRERLSKLADDLGRAEVRAPAAGTVAVRHLDPGVVVGPGTPVVRLVGGGALLVRFAVPPDATAQLTPGEPLRVELENPPLVRRAVLRRIAPELDSASQMVFAEARLDGPAGAEAGLPAGAIVRVSPAGAGAAGGCFEVVMPGEGL